MAAANDLLRSKHEQPHCPERNDPARQPWQLRRGFGSAEKCRVARQFGNIETVAVAPYTIRAISEATRVHRLRRDDQFRCESISSIALSCERPKAMSDPDLVQQWVRLVKVKPHAVIEITPVVVSAPEVQQIHDRGVSYTRPAVRAVSILATLFTVAREPISVDSLGWTNRHRPGFNSGRPCPQAPLFMLVSIE